MWRIAIVACVMVVCAGASAQERVCAVNDTSGTPLNVRDRPYGRILGAFVNGAKVRVFETQTDARGDPWVRIVPLGPGSAGWVFRRYVECPSG